MFICVIFGHGWLVVFVQESLSRTWSCWERYTSMGGLHDVMWKCCGGHCMCSPAVWHAAVLWAVGQAYSTSQVMVGVSSDSWAPRCGWRSPALARASPASVVSKEHLRVRGGHVPLAFGGELSPKRLARRVSAALGFTCVLGRLYIPALKTSFIRSSLEVESEGLIFL